MQLSVVIPSYNEAHQIGQTLQTVVEFCRRECSAWEVLVVDDGSTDGTAQIVASAGRVQCLRNAQNRGKGYSVRRGMLAAQYDPILFSDADLSTPIEEMLALQAALQEGADIAIASRKPSAKTVERLWHRRLMAGTFRWLVKILALRGFHDTQCGFKLFRRSATRTVFGLQTIDRWGFDVEILYIARKKKLRVVEVPVAWQEAEQSQVGAITPLTMVGDLLRVRWNDLRGRYRNPTPEVRPRDED
jgi:dolichyl-phosphate beta-glucosyltransferase